MNQSLIAECINTAHAANARHEFDTAIWWSRQALQLAPGLSEGWFNLGVALGGQGKRAEAIQALEKASATTLGSAEAQNSIGFHFIELDAYPQAELCLERAIALMPAYAFPYVNLGKLRAKQKRRDNAVALFKQAIALQHDLAPAYINLGGILNEQNKRCEAEAACRRGIELDPMSPDAWNNLGLVLLGLKHREAAECFSKSLELDPKAAYREGYVLYAKLHACDWRTFAEDRQRLVQKIQRGDKVTVPFLLLALTENLDVQRKATEIYSSDEIPESAVLGPIRRRPQGDERIRIGYFSADFRDHPVSNLMVEVFELQDRSRFELIGFSFSPDPPDEVRQRVSAAFDQFIDIHEKSDLEVAAMSRELGVDIAVDLGGHTQDARTGIFALRAAPVQVSYIGYLGTMGATYFDYLIADKTIVPLERQSCYTEKIAYLPSYQANDSKRRISDRVFTRDELGLPQTGFVFCCFNNNYKITPDIFDVWMKVLQRVAGSVLFLYADNSLASDNLKQEARRRGVDATRLIFAGRIDRTQYLARYRVADLFLDTLPYNAGTTASDALWVGVPVLTCMGESFASRVAASVLKAIDLPELITTTLEEYETLAVELALDPDRLERIKQRLNRNRHTTALFDSPLFTKHLESAFTAMHKNHLTGLPPEHIQIA
jgi:protein O-GlcNAc transferase